MLESYNLQQSSITQTNITLRGLVKTLESKFSISHSMISESGLLLEW
jgi:hypothetical protein